MPYNAPGQQIHSIAIVDGRGGGRGAEDPFFLKIKNNNRESGYRNLPRAADSLVSPMPQRSRGKFPRQGDGVAEGRSDPDFAFAVDSGPAVPTLTQH